MLSSAFLVTAQLGGLWLGSVQNDRPAARITASAGVCVGRDLHEQTVHRALGLSDLTAVARQGSAYTIACNLHARTSGLQPGCGQQQTTRYVLTMTSMCSQSAPRSTIFLHSSASLAKSAEAGTTWGSSRCHQAYVLSNLRCELQHRPRAQPDRLFVPADKIEGDMIRLLPVMV